MHAIDLLIHYPLFRHALLAAVAVGSVCSILSVIVVLKRMAFIGEGIAHSGFGGVGTAVFLGLAVTGSHSWAYDLIVMAFCIATALLIGALTRHRHVEPDSAIGILLVAAMAWGVLMVNLRRNLQAHDWYIRWFGQPHAPPSIESLLFGSILNVSRADALIALVAAGLILLVFFALFKEIVFYTFDETVSRVYGVPARLIHYLLLVLLALAIVITVRLAGIILVSALIIIPGSTALLLSRRLHRVLLLAWIVGVAGSAGGLILSLELGNVSTGPCIVLVLCACFALALLWQRRGLRRASAD